MNGDQTILIFFRLLNFAVLIVIGAYLWKRFGRSAVVAEYKKEQEHLETLTRTHAVLRQEERAIKKGLKADNQERSELKEQLFSWREAVQKERDALATEKEQRGQLLKNRIELQVQRVSEYRLYRQVQKEAIEQVRARLKKQFVSESEQQKVIGGVVNKMNRDTSIKQERVKA